jgi:hypothetical protein
MITGIRLAAAALALSAASVAASDTFDHGYPEYARLLAAHVRPPGVDYRSLKADRARLDRVVSTFDSEATRQEPDWSREQRMAFWINAYNVFTLRAIVDHYPIRAGWFTLQPRNSIRQIDGVWTDLQWRAAGRQVTLDDIEHRILRPVFKEARIHFAVNCASISCPPLAGDPYRADRLDAQLDAAARRYLASREGVQVYGDTLRVSSLFKWYGDDFVGQYAALVPGTRDATERAILGTIVKYGPPDAAAKARSGSPRITFIDYNWALNEEKK